MMRVFFLSCLLCVFSHLEASESYHFIGRHFIAEYYGCDKQAILASNKLKEVMVQASKASGATVLDSVEHHFSPNGYSLVILLSESHASIHTYPDERACFVDLFTCGMGCDSNKFEKVLKAYLKPQKTHSNIIERK